MAVSKPGIPKGTRDFLPSEMVKRNYIFNTIIQVFHLHGFQQIETPAMENLSTLLGKYGEEGDKLLFKLLNSGDYLSKASEENLSNKNSLSLSTEICDRGLRYDLTVPFARFVVQHQNEISFPFKRYQIQPVWRADRPQKGRYREFYQCDADIIGSDSLFNEVDLVQIIDDVFTRLGINVEIRVNNRKILAGLAELMGATEKLVDVTVAIDKLEKIGEEKVVEELQSKGISQQAIDVLMSALDGKKPDVLTIPDVLKQKLNASELGTKGIEELSYVFTVLKDVGVKSDVVFDVSLARGLNYYTGAIIEVKAKDVEIGSICGGGRYDDLTGIFGLNGVSGVGISFGADRIYDVLNQLNLYPQSESKTTDVMFVNFGEKEALYCNKIIKTLHENGISAELYPDTAKMKKQMNFANQKNVKYVALVGDSEIKENKVSLKNMQTGEQYLVGPDEMVNMFRKTF